MPQAIPLILLAATGIGTGVSVYEGVQAGDQASAQQKQQQQMAQQALQKQQQQEQLTKQEAFKKFDPTAQEQVGGALTPSSFSELVSSLAGYTGDVGLAQKTLFGGAQNEPGLSSGGSPSSTGLTSGIGDVIKRLFNPEPEPKAMFAGGT
jgi:hypothetical protein